VKLWVCSPRSDQRKKYGPVGSVHIDAHSDINDALTEGKPVHRWAAAM